MHIQNRQQQYTQILDLPEIGQLINIAQNPAFSSVRHRSVIKKN